MRQDDIYDVLGVSKTASDREIQKAYRKRCVQTHPDKTGGDRRAFDKVAEAYDILSDDTKRQTYDRFGKAGLDPTNPNNGAAFGGGGAAADMFRNMFQQAQQQRQQQQRRNQTLRYQLEVTLEDLYYGRTQSVTVSPPQSRRQSYQQQRQKRKEVEVHIEKGSLSGQSIVMSGEVDFSDNDSPPGDLVFVLTQARHPNFTRKGHDLAMELTITLEEALCGLRRSIKHLDGSEMWIESATKQSALSNGRESSAENSDNDSDESDDTISSIPIMIRTGDVQVLKGRGMPKRNQNGEFGDLYVQYRVEMPENPRGSRVESVLTREEYKELSRLLSKLEESNRTNRSRSSNRRNKIPKRDDDKSAPKIHSLREAKPSDFGTASGRVEWEEEEHDNDQDFNGPFGSSFFGGQGFGGGRTYSQFHFGGAGDPFGADAFGDAFGGGTAGDDDGNVQCQQM
jgi:DnaJ-class molecular chaperone